MRPATELRGPARGVAAKPKLGSIPVSGPASLLQQGSAVQLLCSQGPGLWTYSVCSLWVLFAGASQMPFKGQKLPFAEVGFGLYDTYEGQVGFENPQP